MRVARWLLLACCLGLVGCGGGGTTSANVGGGSSNVGGASASTSTQVPPAFASSVVVRLDLSGYPPPDSVTSFHVEAVDEGGFQPLTAAVDAPRNLQGGVQDIALGNLPLGGAQIVVQALDPAGRLVSSYVLPAIIGSGPQTAVVTQLVPAGQTREIGLVSAVNGVVSNGGASTSPVISAEGRFVAFQSTATNLVAGTAAGSQEILVRDRLLGTVSRASISVGGSILNGISQEPDISRTGRFVTFRSGDVAGEGTVLRRDRGQGPQQPKTDAVSNFVLLGQGVPRGSRPRIADDGGQVVFQAVVGGQSQVVLRDFEITSVELISQSTQGGFGNGASSAPCISGDGRFVVFFSQATDLIAGGTPGIYLRDRQSQTTTRLPIPAGLVNTNISSGGRFVLASAPDQQPFLFDRDTGSGVNVPVGGGLVGIADLSTDGRYVTFFSNNSTLIPNDVNGRTDVFVRDMTLGVTSRVNVASDGTSVFGGVDTAPLASPAITANGTRIAFSSRDRALVPNNSNNNLDIYSANVPTPGRLYASVETDVGGSSIQAFDMASVANGTPTPIATIAGRSTHVDLPGKLFLDVTNDRLYVANGGDGTILVFDDISRTNGNVPPDRVMDGQAVFRVDDLFVDVGRDKLYVCGSDDVQIFDNASTLHGDLNNVAHRQISIPNTGGVRAILVDVRLDELYMLSTENLGKPFVGVVGDASTLSSTNPTLRRKLFGTTPFLQQTLPMLLAFDPFRTDFQGAAANDAALLVIDQVNTVSTFNSNGSRTGFLGSSVAANPIVLGTSPVIIVGTPPKETAIAPFAQVVVDPTMNVRYMGDKVQQSVQVFNSGATSFPPARTVFLPGRPRGLALDRTR